MDARWTWGLAIGVAVLTCVCFLPSLSNGFVNWDDDVNFLNNPHYRGLGLENLRWMFSDLWGHYIPITWLSLALDYVIWGLDPFGYHLTSLILHSLNAVLCFVVIHGLLRAGMGRTNVFMLLASATGALFFAIHPLRVESVVWATERRDVLCGFFFLLSLWAYLARHEAGTSTRRGHILYAASLACFALSLLSKAIGIALPLVLLVMDAYPLRRWSPGQRVRAILIEKLPFVALSAGAAFITLIATQQADAALADYPWLERIMQPGYRLGFYLMKTLIPVNLSPLYLYRPAESLFAPLHLLTGLAVAGLSLGVFALRKRIPAALAAWVAFVLLLAPFLGVLLQGGSHFAADRYTYLAALPLAALLASELCRPHCWTTPAVAVTTTVLLTLGTLSFQQSRVWQDSRTLWTHAIELDPRNSIAFFKRGTALLERNDRAGAERDFDRAVQLDPQHVRALVNRGNLRKERGNSEGALADYAAAIAVDPGHTMAYVNRANLRRDAGETEAALVDYSRAIEIDPDSADAYANRGGVRAALRDLKGARADFERALAVAAPDWPYRPQLERAIRSIEKSGPFRADL